VSCSFTLSPVLAIAVLLPASLSAQRIPVKTRGPLMVAEVRLNGQGPFRMIVDTGATSCSIRPAVARRLHLTAQYRVEDVTPAGNLMIPGTRAVEVQLGSTVAKEVAFLWQGMDGLGETGFDLDGVIGQTFLARYDYLLNYRTKELAIDAAEPVGGKRIGFSLASKRILIPAMHPEEGSLRLVLDSAASNVFLWGMQNAASSASTVLIGLNGKRSASILHMPILVIGDQVLQKLDAVLAPSPEVQKTEDGLLPTVLFQSVYVSNSQSFVKLRR
jgi:hypothetical protein